MPNTHDIIIIISGRLKTSGIRGKEAADHFEANQSTMSPEDVATCEQAFTDAKEGYDSGNLDKFDAEIDNARTVMGI